MEKGANLGNIEGNEKINLKYLHMISARVNDYSAGIKKPLEFFILAMIITHCSFLQSNAKQIKGDAITQNITVNAGWNILSLPVVPADSLKSLLFPTSISEAIIYQDGYQLAETLHVGQGFWIKFDAPASIELSGETILENTVDLKIGWNIIGALSSPIPVNTVETDPPGIIVSNFYYYVSGVGLKSTDTLQPGLGYWVKVK